MAKVPAIETRPHAGRIGALMNKLAGLCLGIVTSLTNVDRPDEQTRYEFTQIVMGVSARLVFFADNQQQAHDAAQKAFARLNELDGVMSDYRNDSELMRLCRAGPGEPASVSDDLRRVLTLAQDISRRTDGAYDCTVGPVVRLWRQARKDGQMPDTDALASARTMVGPNLFDVDHSAGTVTLARPGVAIDLGGIGKGFAADEAIRTFASLGITAALVDLGGDVRVSGPPPGREGWTVVVDDGSNEPYTIRLSHGAVATSGDREQNVVIDGKRYSHIVDPRTGMALTTRASATVFASTGVEADALASAACVLGPDAWGQVAGRFAGVEGIVSWTCEPNPSPGLPTTRSTRTGGFPKDGQLWTP